MDALPDPGPLLAELLDHSPVAIGLFDPQERLRHTNQAFREAYAIEPGEHPTWEALMRRWHAQRRGLLIDTDDIDAWLARVRRTHRQVPQRTFESDLADGRWMWVSETLRPDGWLVLVTTDVTALKANETTMRSARDQAILASLTDPLTEMHNRRSILKRLDDLLVVAHGMRYPLTVVLLDLDHFKLINDQHGHAVGDAVLRNFSQVMRRQIRPLDTVGRIGGEEFLLLMPNSRALGAHAVLARLRAALASEAPLPCTFSAGIAETQPGDTAQLTLRRADAAMYAAKGAGRDRSCVAAFAPLAT
jgi:diguanylate cyclase